MITCAFFGKLAFKFIFLKFTIQNGLENASPPPQMNNRMYVEQPRQTVRMCEAGHHFYKRELAATSVSVRNPLQFPPTPT